MSDPAPDSTPAPDPTPVPSVPAPLAPGYTTSEAWITAIVMAIGALPSTGLLDNAPLLSKIVGMVIAGLAAIHYTAQRSALKRAYLRSSGQGSKTAAKIATAALLIGGIATLVIALTSCGSLNCKDPKNASSVACVVEGSVVDCTGVSSLSSAVAVVTPIVEKLVATALQADGSIAASIEAQLEDLALQYGMCTVAEVWSKLSHPATGSGSGSDGGVKTATRHASPSALAETFDRVRARVAPKKKFKTSGGTL